MSDIQYLAPTTLDEAVSAYSGAKGSARILAGGTDLLVQMRAGMINPSLIVDIKKIEEINTVRETEQGVFVVGASVSGMELAKNPNFGKTWPSTRLLLSLSHL